MSEYENNYIDVNDPNLQFKLYNKREYIYNKVPDRPDINDFDAITDHRNKLCSGVIDLYDHQTSLANYINPDTPYRGLLIFHGVGTGKTCTAITIAEKFKSQVAKYNTKIYVLVPGQLLKNSWKKALIDCTKNTYLSHVNNNNIHLTDRESDKLKKVAIVNALQYYKFMTYSSFYKRVLGERIVDKKTIVGNKLKIKYKKTDSGKYERDVSTDKLYNLNNSLLIIDEAHNITENIYGEAIKEIIKNSTNLKVVLLTATPMKNLGDDIIDLINILRPLDSQIEREKIFNSNYNHLMNFNEKGESYFRKMINGYISSLRGDPYIFAKRVDVGTKPKELLFTNIIPCKMSQFQESVYLNAVHVTEDALDRKTEAVANFVIPGLSRDQKSIEGFYGREGLNTVKNQLKNNQEQLNKLISQQLKLQDTQDLLYLSETGKTITGRILHKDLLINFSTKFHKALDELEQLVINKKGPKIAFIYSNLVKVGIELFEEVLKQNGYLEYLENGAYKISSNTKCYYCGIEHKFHSNNNSSDNNSSGNSSDHTFYPGTFISFTGKNNDETVDIHGDDKQHIIDNVFNHIDNKEGRHIKFILGSVVMNEGISLKHVAEVHILDVYYNFARVDQVVGRATRTCSHHKLINDKNRFPEVLVYKYAVVTDNRISSEIDLYRKAEMKYILVKKIERIMKEMSIDCPLNIRGNMFQEEMDTYKDCTPFVDCPAQCDFTKCDFKCYDEKLNLKYYDPSRKIYKSISKSDLDFSTFTYTIASNQINHAKTKIKEMFLLDYAYVLDQIIDYVKNSYVPEKKDSFDNFFVYKALDELLPTTENDLNNFTEVVYDKYYRPGYLIFVNNYYIFQPFDQNENVLMYYRTTMNIFEKHKLGLKNYIHSFKLDLPEETLELSKQKQYYEYNLNYYDDKKDYKYVGIIDHEPFKKGNTQIKDIFKIRQARVKTTNKKRGIGIQTFKGTVCATALQKQHLKAISKSLNVSPENMNTRSDMCDNIFTILLEKEKYNNDGYIYMMIPENHSTYPFPYNLKDRVQYITNDLKQIGIECNVTEKDKKYIITLKDKITDKIKTVFDKYKVTQKKDTWIVE